MHTRQFASVLLLLALGLTPTQSRSTPEGFEFDQRGIGQHQLQLQQHALRQRKLLALCPATCRRCVMRGTMGTGLSCAECYNDLQVISGSNDPADDGDCGCPAGKYITNSGSAATCTPCTQGYYCTGGKAAPVKCPDNMDTAGSGGAKRVTACLNKPGYYYVPPTEAGQNPSATVCPDHTYNAGMNRQKQCRRCPAGFMIEDNTQIRSDPSFCMAPPGWFVLSAGAAARCPRGEYKANYNLDPKCSKCGRGITTQQTASTSVAQCNTVLPGFNGRMDSLVAGVEPTSIYLCPQNSFCAQKTLTSVTEESKTSCGGGLWTRDRGSKSRDQCLVPPGYRFDSTTNTTEKCGNGFFRDGWQGKDAPAAATCSSCGTNINSEMTHALTKYGATTGAITYELVRGSSYSCYVEPGWAMYRTSDGQFRAEQCSADNVYGASARLYGLTASPCRMCPSNMKTTLASADDKVDGLAVSPNACLTQAGYGFSSRQADLCDKGTWNGGGNQSPCQECGYGLTTATALTGDVGADSPTNCVLAAGFGSYNSVVQECPEGTYNDDGLTTDGRAIGTACTACTTGLTTLSTGSTASTDCSVCAQGYGSSGCSACTSGSYSTGGSLAACTSCPASTTFFFSFPGATDEQTVYVSGPTSKAQASSSADCLASFAQMIDGSVLASATVVAESGAATLSACVATCTGSCQFVNFDYSNSSCTKRVATAGASGDNYLLLAVKTLFAGDTEASSTSIGSGGPSSKSIGSGLFSFWEDSVASDVGTYTAAAGGTTRTACLDACTTDATCAAVRITYNSSKVFTSCGYVRSTVVSGGTVRTLLRAAPAQLSMPAGYADA